MAISIIDVAKMANVSTATASRVINQKDSNIPISEGTKFKVLNAVEKLNYRPNALARGLVTLRTRTIGVVVPNMSTLFFPEVIESIESFARNKDYHIILSMSENNPDEEKECVETFLEKRVDGIIIAPTQLGVPNVEYFEELQERDIPIVFIDMYLGEVEKDFVIIDNKLGAYEAVEYLIKLGHRRIGHIGGPRELSAVQDRLTGYIKALESYNIEYDDKLVKELPNIKKEAGYQGMKELIEANNPLTAIFAVTDMVAIGALKAIREAGMKVPEDISLVGFDDIELASFLEVPLTTVSQQQHRIGNLAAEIVIERIEKKGENKHHQIILKPKLIVRESCRDLRENSEVGEQ